MGNFSVLEIIPFLLVSVLSVGLPLAIAIWVIVTLRAIRRDQEAILHRLDMIEGRRRTG